MRMVGLNVTFVAGVSRAVAALAAALVAGVLAACGSDSASPPPSTTPTSSSRPAASTSSSTPDFETTTGTTTDFPDPAGQLPGDLIPNVVEDECLLSAAEYETFAGRTGIRADNTELAGDGRRSCFYADETADEPAARIDVYSSASLPPADLVARIAANSPGSRALAGIGAGAVVVSAQDGSYELVVAATGLLAVLTVLPSGTAVPPPDDAWAAAATAMLGRLPA